MEIRQFRIAAIAGVVLFLIVSKTFMPHKNIKKKEIVLITGSSSTEKIINDMKAEFEAMHPGTAIQYTASGSSAGIKDAILGISQIGASSRELTAEEKREGVRSRAFALDGIAVAVHPYNPIHDIKAEQLQKIYSGEIRSWSEISNRNETGNCKEVRNRNGIGSRKKMNNKNNGIYVLSREASSGTRETFEEILQLKDAGGLTSRAAISEGNGAIKLSISGNPNAVGYLSFAYVDEQVKQLTVDREEGTKNNIKNHRYPLFRPFLFVWNEKYLKPSGKKFLEFAFSVNGQECVEKNKAIRIDQ